MSRFAEATLTLSLTLAFSTPGLAAEKIPKADVSPILSRCFNGKDGSACKEFLDHLTGDEPEDQVRAAAGMGCQAGERSSCNFYAEHHPLRYLEAWPSTTLSLSLNQRITAATPTSADLAWASNGVFKFVERPRPIEISPSMRRKIEAAVGTMPEPIRQLALKYVYGIQVISQLGSTALAMPIRNENGKRIGGMLFIDRVALDSLPDAWITWKESTAFKPETGWRLQGRVTETESEKPDEVAGLRLILLHEFAHLISFGMDLMPELIAQTDQIDLAKYPYTALSWSGHKAGGWVSTSDSKFAKRPQIVFYQPVERRKISLSEAPEIITQLKETSFPTVYGATHPDDDWAEGFATYAHTVMLKKPYRMQVLKNDQVVAEYGACWDEARCAEKRKLIEKVIGPWIDPAVVERMRAPASMRARAKAPAKPSTKRSKSR